MIQNITNEGVPAQKHHHMQNEAKAPDTHNVPPMGHPRGQVPNFGNVGRRPSLCSETKMSCKTGQNKGGLQGGDRLTGPGDEGPSLPPAARIGHMACPRVTPTREDRCPIDWLFKAETCALPLAENQLPKDEDGKL